MESPRRIRPLTLALPAVLMLDPPVKQFGTAFSPEGRYGIAGGRVRTRLFTKITNFILTNL
jgi:hypothetical protein